MNWRRMQWEACCFMPEDVFSEFIDGVLITLRRLQGQEACGCYYFDLRFVGEEVVATESSQEEEH